MHPRCQPRQPYCRLVDALRPGEAARCTLYFVPPLLTPLPSHSSPQLNEKILQLTIQIASSSFCGKDPYLLRGVITEAVPPSLLDLLGYDEVIR